MARFLASLGGAIAIATAAAAAPPTAEDILGEVRYYFPGPDETLLDAARAEGLGVLEVMAANPGVDPWVPGADLPILWPSAHILPDAPREGIVINLAELRLYHFPGNGKPPTTTAIGVGREGFATPVGQTRIVRKKADPSWTPTASARTDNPELPAVVPPGPDNPLGRYALYLGWETYLIHGTNKPWGVGRRVSRGCIRLYPERIESLFHEVAVGSRVTVVAQPLKLGWRAGELYIEVHPDLDQLDQLEETGTFPNRPVADVRELILAKAADSAARLDWGVIGAALNLRLGTPVRITRPPNEP